jgi:hypothetical protein
MPGMFGYIFVLFVLQIAQNNPILAKGACFVAGQINCTS